MYGLNEVDTASMLGGVSLAVIGVSGLIGLLFFVWTLWAYSRLFPKLGLPSWAGWVPLWNQWQIIERGALPGWLVLLGFIPGLAVVPWIVGIVAVHRINTEHGKGGGYTVLYVFLPPVWAMLLAKHIGAQPAEYGFAPTPPAAGVTATQQQAPGTAAAGGFPAQGNPFGAQPQGFAPQPVPSAPAAAGVPPVPPQTPQPPAPEQLWDTPVPVSSIDDLFGVPEQAPVAPVPPAPVPPAPGSSGRDWGFSTETEGDFERLAARRSERPAPEPLGVVEPSRPFSWPGPEEPEDYSQNAPIVLPEPPAPPVQAPPAPPAPPAPSPQEAAAPTVDPADLGTPVAAAVQAPGVAAVDADAPQSVQAPEAAAPAADDELDRTVVVSRRPRWGLELPDGEIVELTHDDLVIGRKPVAADGAEALLINDPTRTMSKSHVRMRREGSVWTVEDLGSTNGVALVSPEGKVEPIEAGKRFEATDKFVIGTLEVTLRPLG